MGEPEPNLLAYLGDHDAPCLGCGYNLRGLCEPRCPECSISYAALDTDRYKRILRQGRIESRFIKLGCILLPIEAAAMVLVMPHLMIGAVFILFFDEQAAVWGVLLAALDNLLLAVWVPAWFVFMRTRRRPLGRFAALGEAEIRWTRVGIAAVVIDVIAVLLAVLALVFFVGALI